VKYNNSTHLFEQVPTGKIAWQSPSNIALVKYWGKTGQQIPANASISFTLSNSHTQTTIDYSPAKGSEFGLAFYLEGVLNSMFGGKISSFFKSLTDIFPFINQLDFKINSTNSFPHSAGIASSASGMSALALCLCDIERQYFNTEISDEEFLKKASFVSRLGSGSACRSIYGGLVSWGEINGGSNLYGSAVTDKIHSIYGLYHDSILIVDSGEKKVSSTIGHGLMNDNPFSDGRFKQAADNIESLLQIMETCSMEDFMNIVESEALSLHAMMMTSSPYYILMKPNTIAIIDKVWEFRKETSIPLCFTLDAGPNIHLLYPDVFENDVKQFIDKELLQLTSNNMVIHDKVGSGPKKLEI